MKKQNSSKSCSFADSKYINEPVNQLSNESKERVSLGGSHTIPPIIPWPEGKGAPCQAIPRGPLTKREGNFLKAGQGMHRRPSISLVLRALIEMSWSDYFRCETM